MNYYMYNNPFFNTYYPKYNSSYYNYCPPITYNILSDNDVHNVKNKSNNNVKEDANNRYNDENCTESSTETLNMNDVISISEDRISILGVSMNTDDLIILFLLFQLLKNSENIDYILVIVLGLMLFSQD